MDQTKQHPDLTSFSFLGDSMCSRLPLQGREFTVHNTLDLVSTYTYTDTILLTCIYVHMEKSETLFLNQQKMDKKQEKEKLKQKHKQE